MNKYNNKRKKDKRNRYIIALIVILLLLLIRGLISQGMDLISRAFLPVQTKIYAFGNKIIDTKELAKNYKKILEENKILKEENIKYSLVVQENSKLEEENKRYREILKIKDKRKVDFIVAKINFRATKNLYNKFYIDLGEKNGIHKNMIVLSQDTVIGKVDEVYEDYSVVTMITNEYFNISALSESNMLGIIKGSDEDDGTMYFEPNTFENNLKVGEKLYTSGISDIYPKGLYLGEISEIDEDDKEIFKSIKVKNDIDILNLREVIILTFNKTKR